MIEELMKIELKAVLDAGYILDIGYMDDEKTHFFFYLHDPKIDRKKGVYGHMLPKEMTDREIAFAA